MINATPQQEKFLFRITNLIHENHDFSSILRQITQQTRTFLPVDRLKIYQFAEDGSGEVVAEAVDLTRLPSLYGLHFPATDIPPHAREQMIANRCGVVIDVAAKRKILYPQSRYHDPKQTNSKESIYEAVDPCHLQYLLTMGVLSSFSIPIFYWDNLWGLIVAHHSEPRRFTEEERQLFELLSKHISLALAQQILFKQSQDQQQQEQFLERVSAIFAECNAQSQCWQTVLSEILKTLRADGGRIYLAPDITGKPAECYTQGTQPIFPKLEENPQWLTLMKGIRILDESGTSSLYTTCTVKDLAKNPQLHLLAEALSRQSLHSLLFIPLRSQNQWIGCLTLFRQEQQWEKRWAGRDNPDFRNRLPRQSFEVWCEIQRGAPEWNELDLKLAIALSRQLYLIVTQQRLSHLIQHQAAYDALTQLPNWMIFNHHLTLALVDAVYKGEMLGVILLDLDQFKRINESLGHSSGDYLIQATAQRLQDYLEASSEYDYFLARWHGDGFVLLLNRVLYSDEVISLAQALLKCLQEPFHLQSQTVYLSASLGITFAPYDGNTAEIIIRNAETAMYQAKNQGKNTYQLYNPDLNQEDLNWLTLAGDLRKALERNEFLLHYQPQVDLKTGKITAMEALIRWHHPRFGMVSPAKFIPLAEEIGLIHEIGEWVLKTACSQHRSWQLAGLQLVRMAVNLSALQFQKETLVETISQILAETKMDSRYLELEITESTLMQKVESTIAILEKLKQMGIQISIDDFGTGYSSLSTLKHLPVHTLKIDQSFIRDMVSDDSNLQLCRGIILLGKAVNLHVIAEGVETQEQIALLQEMQCDLIQGYCISRPLPPDHCVGLLMKSQVLQVTESSALNLLSPSTPLKLTETLSHPQPTITVFDPHTDVDISILQQELTHKIEEYSNLKADMQQKAARERIVSQVAQKIRQSLKLEDILNTTVTEVRHLLNTDRVFLYQFDENWSGQVVVESVATPQLSILGEWIDEPCFRERYVKYYRQGRVKAIEDITQAGLAPCHLELLQHYQVKSNLVLPVVYQAKLWGLLIAHECRQSRCWQSHEITLLSQIATQAAIAIHQGELYDQLTQANLRLQKLSAIDGLTQVANRRQFDLYLTQEWRRLMRSRDSLSLILCDIDYFKAYNDTYGHLSGDSCLQQVAQAIQVAINRPADLVARYGGEEFAIILPQTSLIGALHLAQTIQQNVRELALLHNTSPHHRVTLSLGVASFIPNATLTTEVLICQADQALYQSKAEGRDRISCADSDADPR